MKAPIHSGTASFGILSGVKEELVGGMFSNCTAGVPYQRVRKSRESRSDSIPPESFVIDRVCTKGYM